MLPQHVATTPHPSLHSHQYVAAQRTNCCIAYSHVKAAALGLAPQKEAMHISMTASRQRTRMYILLNHVLKASPSCSVGPTIGSPPVTTRLPWPGTASTRIAAARPAAGGEGPANCAAAALKLGCVVTKHHNRERHHQQQQEHTADMRHHLQPPNQAIAPTPSADTRVWGGQHNGSSMRAW
jgi:hypothetical protein